MKDSKSSGMYRPFENLRALLNERFTTQPVDAAVPCRKKATASRSARHDSTAHPSPESDQELFLKAMADVRPIQRSDRAERHMEVNVTETVADDSDDEALCRLKTLIRTGEGFIVADTPEYMEGTGYHVHPEVTRRLHRGEFSIQAHIDLHGLGVDDARSALEMFFRDAIRTGKRAVLIVHGRGLSSPAKPILKAKVYEWLTAGPWRKWVIAFTSARSIDGGAGASYVLLRNRPVTKKLKKSSQSNRNRQSTSTPPTA